MKKILIAGRGEIALRVMQTCRSKGMATVAIYTEQERNAPHVHQACESYSLGEGPLSETYLNIDKIISITKKAQAQAVHPTYGLLSEQAAFAESVRKAGLIFIGPNAQTMALMGSKNDSKKKMEELGVPLIPGYFGDNNDQKLLKQKAVEIGFPLLIKASLGGGGKGMRIVESAEHFTESLAQAKREAESAFGHGHVILEKYIKNPRHIEVQVMSDQHGNHFHFYERECSIQRRYQKIIEEAPSMALDSTLREEILEMALRITRGVDYENAGTVEFILDEEGHFYFLEMNTRLQVEHPITEMITGWDLVDLQIRVAYGEELPFKQKEINRRGHAMELRLYAEDPDKDFFPQMGDLLHLKAPNGPHLRFDCGYKTSNSITADFDPLLAKLSVYGRDREECRLRALHALSDTCFLGVKTNRDYLARILRHKAFQEGRVTTDFVKTYSKDLTPRALTKEDKALLIAGHFFSTRQQKAKITQNTLKHENSWDRLSLFRAF